MKVFKKLIVIVLWHCGGRIKCKDYYIARWDFIDKWINGD